MDFAELGSALHAVVRHDSPAHRPRCSAGRLHSRRENDGPDDAGADRRGGTQGAREKTTLRDLPRGAP